MSRPTEGRWVVLLREKVAKRDMRAHYYDAPTDAIAICGIGRRENGALQETIGTKIAQCQRADYATCASCRILLRGRADKKKG